MNKYEYANEESMKLETERNEQKKGGYERGGGGVPLA